MNDYNIDQFKSVIKYLLKDKITWHGEKFTFMLPDGTVNDYSDNVTWNQLVDLIIKDLIEAIYENN